MPKPTSSAMLPLSHSALDQDTGQPAEDLPTLELFLDEPSTHPEKMKIALPSVFLAQYMVRLGMDTLRDQELELQRGQEAMVKLNIPQQELLSFYRVIEDSNVKPTSVYRSQTTQVQRAISSVGYSLLCRQKQALTTPSLNIFGGLWLKGVKQFSRVLIVPIVHYFEWNLFVAKLSICVFGLFLVESYDVTFLADSEQLLRNPPEHKGQSVVTYLQEWAKFINEWWTKSSDQNEALTIELLHTSHHQPPDLLQDEPPAP
ncbi:hypothetical protein M413DRAFT_10433 [Hebeloma cylindrosporum]|uniref:Uncharacterized protein n=1 Tax=Hebeloma cylindrosporum TaxID=76867 RepID=A0A0C2YMK6_HEBCY|nr:hypothetical protein M413DRAFT_10433 [Hebeloma cylindrosporum h7]